MFPVTITLQNAAQLNAVMAALQPTTKAPGLALESGEFIPAANLAKDPVAKKPATTAAAASSPTPAAAPAPAPTTDTSTSSSSEPEKSAAPAVTFDVLKKAFLALSTKEGGRSKCEGVLKPHGLGKLSEAKEEQYAALLDAINKAAA